MRMIQRTIHKQSFGYIDMKGRIVLGIVLGLVIGFFAGRLTIVTTDNVKYVTGEKQSGSIPAGELKPVKVEKPEKSLLPTKPDTVIIDNTRIITQKVDTAGIIADYELKRSYSFTAFDDKTIGKLELFPSVQYNRLASLDYNFIPVEKIITRSKDKIFTPFVSVDYSTFHYMGVGGGFFYHNLGFEYQYQRSLKANDNGHSFGIKYKF